ELDRQAAGVMAPVRGRREAGTGQGTLERRQPAHGRGGRRRGRDPGQTRDGPGGELIGDTPELVLSSHPRTRSERIVALLELRQEEGVVVGQPGIAIRRAPGATAAG